MNIFINITNQNDLQFAYKQFHSTETALLNTHNDIVDTVDNSKYTAFTILDISAAFDAIDRSILLQRLHLWQSSSGVQIIYTKALTYLTYYLAHNTSHSEFRKDLSLALSCLAYTLRLSAKSLLVIIPIITCLHMFTYHFHNQMHKKLFRL